MTRKVYQEIAAKVAARKSCENTGNDQWFRGHEQAAEELVEKYLPSGSGIDSGVKLNFDESTGDKLVFDSSYHKMNDTGMYDGWVDFQVTITPSLQLGFDLEIDLDIPESPECTCPDDQYDDNEYPHEDCEGDHHNYESLEDYLGDTFHHALDFEMECEVVV